MTAKAKRPQVPQMVHVVWLWNGLGWREELRSYNYNSARREAVDIAKLWSPFGDQPRTKFVTYRLAKSRHARKGRR